MDVTVYGPLRSAIGGKRCTIDFDGGRVAEALEAIVDAYPRSRQYLYGEDGSVRPSVRISVNGDRVTVDDDCPPAADVTIVP
ncbi:MAG: MoaD/ThiS family protein, partial [Halobacteriota archaeon]